MLLPCARIFLYEDDTLFPLNLIFKTSKKYIAALFLNEIVLKKANVCLHFFLNLWSGCGSVQECHIGKTEIMSKPLTVFIRTIFNSHNRNSSQQQRPT